MKLFLAYPFTQLIQNKTGLVNPEETSFILKAVNQLETMGHSVFSAQKREKFGEELMDADTATPLDFQEMKKTDLVVAFPGQFPVSGGVQVELGWASALGKPIIVFLHKGQEYTPMIEGLHRVTNVKYIRFDDLDSEASLIEKIEENVNEYLQLV